MKRLLTFRFTFFCRSGDFWIELRRYSSKFFYFYFLTKRSLTFRFTLFCRSGDFWIEFRRYSSKFLNFYFIFFNETFANVFIFLSLYRFPAFWKFYGHRISKVFFFKILWIFFILNETFTNVVTFRIVIYKYIVKIA